MWKALSHILFTSWTPPTVVLDRSCSFHFTDEETEWFPLGSQSRSVGQAELRNPRHQPTHCSITLPPISHQAAGGDVKKCIHAGSVERLSCLMWSLFDFFQKSEQKRTQKLYIHTLNNLRLHKTFISQSCDEGPRPFLLSVDLWIGIPWSF